MRKLRFELTGTMPLLMHSDSIDGADELEAWRKDPTNKGVSKPGDDRSPPWTWHTYLYRSAGAVIVPSQNIMAALRIAGAKLLLKKQKTFKEATQVGLMCESEWSELKVRGKTIQVGELASLRERSFPEQVEWVRDHGFDLDMRRVRVGSAKHIRIRPKFTDWKVSGEFRVSLPELTDDIVRQLFSLAGMAGIGDWRPSAKTPGPYGQFTADVSAT